VEPLRWGIAGAGRIARRFCSDLVLHAKQGHLEAVAARDGARAEAFARELGVRSHGSYQALAEDPQIDAVYIALIHPFHRPVTELMLRHGKHVLVEKPAFTRLEDWQAMQALAHGQGLLLLEAMKTVVFPAYQHLVTRIREQGLPIRHIRAAFGTWHDPWCGLPPFQPHLCGGATLDVGVYPLWLYADLCRQMGLQPGSPGGTLKALNEKCLVDGSARYRFVGEVEGDLGAAISEDLPRDAELQGPDLRIRMAEKWWNPQEVQIEWQGRFEHLQHPIAGGGFQFEADHFARLVRAGALDSPLLSQAISAQVMGWMEEILREQGFAHLLIHEPQP